MGVITRKDIAEANAKLALGRKANLGLTTPSDLRPLCFLWQVMGVITRKDIAEANAKLALGRKANLGLTTPSERLVRRGSLPFIPYGAYDPTVGYSSSRCAPSCSMLAPNGVPQGP